jgi:hypothetical protein
MLKHGNGEGRKVEKCVHRRCVKYMAQFTEGVTENEFLPVPQ